MDKHDKIVEYNLLRKEMERLDREIRQLPEDSGAQKLRQRQIAMEELHRMAMSFNKTRTQKEYWQIVVRSTDDGKDFAYAEQLDHPTPLTIFHSREAATEAFKLSTARVRKYLKGDFN